MTDAVFRHHVRTVAEVIRSRAMFHKRAHAPFLTLILSAALASCASSSGDQPDPSPGLQNGVSPGESADPGPAHAEPASGAAVKLQGTVLKKPWSKSAESWNAGGSEYYVLDVGDAQVTHRSAREGVTLKVTDAVSAETLESMVGKRVEVSGDYVEAKPYTPEHPAEQYPTGMNGEPMARGAGFAVASITAL